MDVSLIIIFAALFPTSLCSSYVSFHLYRRTQPNGVTLANDVLPIDFDRTKPTYVLLHGLGGHKNDVCVGNIGRALLQTGDVNVLIPSYTQAAYSYTMLYREIAGQISSFLLQNKVNSSRTIVVAQSLGSHIAGVLYTKGFRPDQIIALDPAGPQFDNWIPESAKLSPQSANAVQVVHTNVGGLGTTSLNGNLDVYINGGKDFPCCSSTVCHHIGACHWFVQTIRNGPSAATSCRSQNEAFLGTCKGPYVSAGFGVTPRSQNGRSIAYVSLTECIAPR